MMFAYDGAKMSVTFAFNAPVPETQLPDVVTASSGCVFADPGAAKDLVVAFTVTGTEQSGGEARVAWEPSGAQSSPVDWALLIDSGDGIICQGGAAGGVIDLTKPGDSSKDSYWLILPGTNSTDSVRHLGDPATLGQFGIDPELDGNLGRAVSATGSAVCTGSNTQNAPYWFVVAGTPQSSEQCGQGYTAPVG